MTAEELGGAHLHTTTSGVADHLAENEAHAFSITRSILGSLPARYDDDDSALAASEAAGSAEDDEDEWEEPLYPAHELRGE